MKFSIVAVAVLAYSATLVAGQGEGEACVNCLHTNLLALPKCKGLNITIGDFNPGASPEYAVCLCSSLDGAWIDPCKVPAMCGPDIESLKATYKTNLESAGLNCNGTTPTFSAGPSATVAPSTTIDGSGAQPTGGSGSGGKSFGVKDAVPSLTFIKVMGAVAVAVSLGASML